jgi:D-alanyl-D-alanine carboxypeptidase
MSLPKKNHLVFILALLLSGLLFGEGYKTKGVAIYDIQAGRYLYRNHALTQRPPASTIKVLTALTAWNYASSRWNDYVKVSSYAAAAQPTKAGILVGEQFKLEELVEITLVTSCNDAARAVAEAVSGSEASFAKDMQKVAHKLGMRNTRTTNASGLPSSGKMVTTPEDSIKLILAARENHKVKAMMGMKSVTIRSRAGRSITKINKNRYIRYGAAKGYKHPVKGKTGYTRAAGSCFLSWCDMGGRSIAISMLGAPNSTTLWGDLQKAYQLHMKAKTQASYLPSFMKQRQISLQQLHDKLRRAGFAVSENSYGDKTRLAVRKFQSAKRLKVDGVIGPQTWGALP